MVTGATGQPFQTVPCLVVLEHNIVYGIVTIQAQLLVVCGARATGRTHRSVTQILAQVWRHYIVSIISRINKIWSLMQRQRNWITALKHRNVIVCGAVLNLYPLYVMFSLSFRCLHTNVVFKHTNTMCSQFSNASDGMNKISYKWYTTTVAAFCMPLDIIKFICIVSIYRLTVHGSWSNWSSFSECSQSCGRGIQTRIRQCDSPSPEYGRNSCSGNENETQSCNTDLCPGKKKQLLCYFYRYTKHHVCSRI